MPDETLALPEVAQLYEGRRQDRLCHGPDGRVTHAQGLRTVAIQAHRH